MTNKVPLFVTRHSLSPRSAIGVQTKRFCDANQDWLHFHWWTSEFKLQDRRSILLEHWILSRYSLFKRPGLAKSAVAWLQGSYWKNNRLKPRAASKIKTRYANSISCIYVAPIDRVDAARCRAIVELFDVPFVLHVWDFLDGSLELEEHRWLAMNAARVYCLSKPALERMSSVRSDPEELLFSRDPSAVTSQPPSRNHLTINLIGDVGSYLSGLNLLDDALRILDGEGIDTEVQYIGSARNFNRIASPLVQRTKVLGFFESPADRDRALSNGNVSFLPGPIKDPNLDLRSRYSIPSRVLDYFAVGTPIVGTVHPNSATGVFLSEHQMGDGSFKGTPREIADGLKSLLVRSVWESESSKSKRAFSSIARNPSPEKLQEEMQAAMVHAPGFADTRAREGLSWI